MRTKKIYFIRGFFCYIIENNIKILIKEGKDMAKKKTDYPVKFFKGTSEQYNSIIPNMYTFYFLTDVDKVYLGDIEISNRDIAERIEYLNIMLGKKANIEMKTTAEWNENRSMIGQENTFYIYTDRDQKEDGEGNIINIPGIKVGDGRAYLIDLPFVDDLLLTHINNLDIHVTLADKAFWSNKLNVDDEQQIIDNSLIFNRN